MYKRQVVTDLLCKAGIQKKELLQIAASLEKLSEHPLADAIVAEADNEKLPLLPASEFTQIPGQGIVGRIGTDLCLAGNRRLLNNHQIEGGHLLQLGEDMAMDGKTPLFFARGGELIGVIAVADVVKPTSKQAVQELSRLGLEVVMLTGDNAKTAEAIRRQVGVDRVVAEVFPQDKEKEIRRLQSEGKKVAMVGDGINDAPALASADVGIAIGAGTDVAIESADIVLMKNDLIDAVGAIRLSKAVIRNIKENLFWAFFYNSIGIPLAAGLLYPIWGLKLNPMFGAAAMSLSSVCVVSNALRLRWVKLGKKSSSGNETGNMEQESAVCENRAVTSEIKTKSDVSESEEQTMKTTLSIEGMMCGHCQATVEKALKGVPGVSEVVVSLEDKNAVVTAEESVSADALKAAVVDAGYEVTNIQ